MSDTDESMASASEDEASTSSFSDFDSSSDDGSSSSDDSDSSSSESSSLDDSDSSSDESSSLDDSDSSSVGSSSSHDSNSSSDDSDAIGGLLSLFMPEHEYDSDISNSSYGSESSTEPVIPPPSKVLKLEKMATFGVALELWNRATVDVPKTKFEHVKWRKSLREQIFQRIPKLPVPECVKARVKDYVSDIMSRVKAWIARHSTTVFSRRRRKWEMYQYVGHIVWHRNGAINDRETANNLLICDGLSDFEKFEVACTYCVREGIRDRMLSLPVLVRNNFVFRSLLAHPLILYWKVFCATEPSEVSMNTLHFIGKCMIREESVDNWPAIEYFFDLLSVAEQVNTAVWLIKHRGVEYQDLILSKLNEIQRLTVYETCATRMIVNVVKNYGNDMEQNAIAVWYEVRGLIDLADFFLLFRKLLSLRQNNNVLTEIWTSCSDDYKFKIMNFEKDDFIEQVLDWACYNVHHSFDFVFVVLSDRIKMNTKREKNMAESKFFNLLCQEFVKKNDFQLLITLLNLGIPNSDERTKFRLRFAKKIFFKIRCRQLAKSHQIDILGRLLSVLLPETAPESKEIARDLLSESLKRIDVQYTNSYLVGNLRRMNELLAPLVVSYSEAIQEYKQNLLFSNTGIETCANHVLYSKKCTKKLDKIFKDCRLSNVKLINEFGKRLIFSFQGVEKLLHVIVSGKRLECAREVLDRYLKCRKDKKKLKRRLVGRLEEENSRLKGAEKKKKCMAQLSKLKFF